MERLLAVLAAPAAVVGLVLSLNATPALAQQSDDQTPGALGVFGAYSLGNLALQDVERGKDPVVQMKRFFSEARLPLTSSQEDQLKTIIDAEVNALQATSPDKEALRRINVEYNRKINTVLTAEQRAELRRYRSEQIMLRGGFEALRVILENGNAPLIAEQEKHVQDLYLAFDRQVAELPRDSKGEPDRAKLGTLAGQELGKVVRLLTPEQRRVLAASRQGTLTVRVRP
jgi:hypothetical protein